jgi:hypothetical protein
MPGLDRPYDHKLKLCNLGEDPDGFPYRVLTKLRTYPAYSEVINFTDQYGKSYPKQVFRHEVSHVEATVTDGERVWYGLILANKFNVSRKRVGGRDDTWEKEEFDLIMLDALQNPFENPGMKYVFRQRDDDGALLMDIKDTKDTGKVVNLAKNLYLKLADVEQEGQEHLDIDSVMDSIHAILTDHLCIGVRIGDLDHCEHLEELGGYVDKGVTDDDWPPLHLACYFGHLHIVKWLVTDMEVDVDHVATDKTRPIYIAAMKGFNDIVKFLIESGADHQWVTDLEQNIMHVGLYNKHRAVVETFVGEGEGNGLHRKPEMPRPKEPLESMFQLGRFYEPFSPGRTDIRFPIGHDRWPFAGVDAHKHI